MKTKVCIAFCALCLLAASTAWADDEPLLAYVDLQRAILEVEDGQEAMERLQEELADRQEGLDDSETALRELTEALEQELVLMDEEAREQALITYQEQVGEYQQQFVDNQQELLLMEQEATAEILERMLTIVDEIALERGLLMVFERTRSSLVWAAEGLDLTDEVIERYEDRH